MLIFDGYSSHLTQQFIDFCWQHNIRPFQLIPYSTHLCQPCDVGAFQKLKHEFKKLIREEVFYSAKAITKTDFFSIFQTFSNRTFTPVLCQSAFRKAGLIPYDPSVVLSKMKDYGGQQGRERSCSIDSSDAGFATPPPPPWHEFTTPVTNTGRRRGAQYVVGRLQTGQITPTVIRVQEKVEKAADKMILAGQLSTELLSVDNAKQKAREERNNAPNKIVQKYGEIYGNVARRQIAADELAEDMVVNMHEKRLRKPYLEYYKWFVREYPDIFYILREDGRFKSTGTLEELLLI